MDPLRRAHPLSLVLALALLASGASSAAAGAAGLYDQPVLTLEPGMHTAMIWRADVSATGAYAVTGSEDKTVRVWDVQTGRLLRTIRLPQGPGLVGLVYAVAISPDGALVAAAGWTAPSGQIQAISLFRRDTGALVRRLKGLPSAVNHLAFSPTGRYLAATLQRTHGLRVYDRAAGWQEVARDGPYGDDSFGAAFAADGRLATTSRGGTLRLYDATFRRVAMAKTPDGTQPVGLAFSPAGDRLAVGYQDTTAVSLVDGHTLTPLPGPDTRGIDTGNLGIVAWSADGATLYAAGQYPYAGTKHVVAWSEAAAGLRRELAAGTDTVTSLRPLPDGGLLVAAAEPLARGAGRGRGAALGATPAAGRLAGSGADAPRLHRWGRDRFRLRGRGEGPGPLRPGAAGAHPRPTRGRANPPPGAGHPPRRRLERQCPPDTQRDAAGALAV